MRHNPLFNITVIAALAAATMMLCCCGDSKKDEPDGPDVPGTTDEQYQPLTGLDPNVPLFNGYDRIVGYTLWPAENKADASLTGEGFSYDYWYEHKGEAKSLEGLLDMCEVPQETLDDMSTHNLVLTCFMHPYNSIYNAYDNQYIGIMSAMKANCWQELMVRETGGDNLLDLYCELTYPLTHDGTFHTYLSYLNYQKEAADNYFSLSALSLVAMTAVDSKVYSPEQLTRLAGEIFNKIENIDKAGELLSYVGAMRYPFLLGAAIAYRFDHSLSPLELSYLYDLTGFQGIPGHDPATDRYFTAENVTTALNIVTRSLERIEQGSLLTNTTH